MNLFKSAFLVLFLLFSSTSFAQFDADDSFDPFADYSEFEGAEDEEADINFFRNGRFVTMGFMGGVRNWTEGLGQILSSSNPHFGFFLNYFFDLRFALQFSFLTGDHDFGVKTTANNKKTGNVGIQNFGVDLKYYVNTQNVTRGLAAFNPYFIGGISQMYRTTTVSGVTGFGKESATAFDLGAGIEFPMLRNKMFFGFQGLYQLVTFKNENSPIVFNNGEQTGIYPTGDTYTAVFVMGVNF